MRLAPRIFVTLGDARLLFPTFAGILSVHRSVTVERVRFLRGQHARMLTQWRVSVRFDCSEVDKTSSGVQRDEFYFSSIFVLTVFTDISHSAYYMHINLLISQLWSFILYMSLFLFSVLMSTIQGVSKKSFTTLKAYINLFRRHGRVFVLMYQYTPSFTWDS
jgi:hypothetical protein